MRQLRCLTGVSAALLLGVLPLAPTARPAGGRHEEGLISPWRRGLITSRMGRSRSRARRCRKYCVAMAVAELSSQGGKKMDGKKEAN